MKKEKASSVNKDNTALEKTASAAENNSNASAPAAEIPVETGVTRVGSLLKEMRIQKGLKVADIAKKLCIRRFYLEAIEESNYKDIPEFPYGIGFIRSYADYLGLNSGNIIELYKEETNSKPEKDIFVLEPQTEATVPNKKYLLISLLAIILIYVLWYMYNNRNIEIAETPVADVNVTMGQVEDINHSLPLVVEDYSSAPAEVAKAEPEKIAVVDSTVPVASTNQQVVITNEAFTGEIGAPSPLVQETEPLSDGVVIKVKKETWIEVKDGSKLYISKVLQPGDSYTVPQGKGMILSVGKADGVDVVINGKVADVINPNKKMNISLDKFINAANH